MISGLNDCILFGMYTTTELMIFTRAAVRYHHQPEQCSEDGPLCAIVYLADLLMSRFHSGLEIERMETHGLTKQLVLLGITREDFDDLVDLIPPSIYKSTESV